MKCTFPRLSTAFTLTLLVVNLSAPVRSQTQQYRPRIALPAGASEQVNLGIGDVEELKNGSLLATNGRLSRDGGKSWSAPHSFGEGINGNRFSRLQSGAILLSSFDTNPRLWISRDEGASWKEISSAFPKMMGGPNCFGGIQQLSAGRLMTVCSIDFNPKFPGHLYENVQAKGIWKGKPYSVEGHQHLPEIYMSFVAYSDDEAKTWKMAEGYFQTPLALFGWFDSQGIVNGLGGHWSFGECTVAEANNGSLVIFGRSEVGRIVYTTSTDRGITWNALQPTELANSGSPPFLARIPKTGDLLCVWNQMSHEEIRRGYRRGRLTAAISKNNGLTWTHFKTLELSEGLEDVTKIAPEYPISMVRARSYAGELPNDFSYFHYPNVAFVGDNVFIMYLRGGPVFGIAEQKLGEQRDVLRTYPLKWFYK